jgi:hypothetical protein
MRQQTDNAEHFSRGNAGWGSRAQLFQGRQKSAPKMCRRKSEPSPPSPRQRSGRPRKLAENHLPKGSVSIYPDYASHARLLFVQRTGAAGYTTTTDSRSRRNRASRRGGQLQTRARSSTYKIGLPAPSCSRRLCPGWSHHMPRSRKPQPDIGAGTLIPVTNAIEALDSKLPRRLIQRPLPKDEAAMKLLSLVLNAPRKNRLCQLLSGRWPRPGSPGCSVSVSQLPRESP